MNPDLRGHTVLVLHAHPDDSEVAPGEEGEVCVSGTCVTAGYLMRDHMAEDPNFEAFSREGAAVGRMLRTGDHVHEPGPEPEPEPEP